MPRRAPHSKLEAARPQLDLIQCIQRVVSGGGKVGVCAIDPQSPGRGVQATVETREYIVTASHAPLDAIYAGPPLAQVALARCFRQILGWRVDEPTLGELLADQHRIAAELGEGDPDDEEP
ncbi:MAG: hypothetical protein ACOY0T_35595 [Myxococcota bacterium]